MATQANGPVKRIVIVGGGSAGWLTAGLLASEHAGGPVEITLVESPDVATIGVGEGTWPTMRSTLRRIGIGESDFLAECQAAFKQGTRFDGWVDGGTRDTYYHPFTAPAGYNRINLAAHWLDQAERAPFAHAVTPQALACDRGLAPKQATTPEYAGVLNYAYHLDAGRFAALLQRHCSAQLGVRHVLDHVTGIDGAPDGDIRAVRTAENGELAGDLFVDCTGFAALLLGRHYGIGFRSCSDVLFNDAALAVQVPYAAADSPIASQTIAAARASGWVWDIGLTGRRGIGFVFSSSHCDDEEARRVLSDYVERTAGQRLDALEPRRIAFEPGHREVFWHRNCVAVGLSAGFLEPLEASALVLIELAGRQLAEELPADRSVMDVVARRYNETFLYRWQRIIDFLKLHYALSRREDSAYWRDNREPGSVPDSLEDLLELWRYHVPWHRDFPRVEEVFSSASHQFVLYGMGFETRARNTARRADEAPGAAALFADNIGKARQLAANLPRNRELLETINQRGLPPPDDR